MSLRTEVNNYLHETESVIILVTILTNLFSAYPTIDVLFFTFL